MWAGGVEQDAVCGATACFTLLVCILPPPPPPPIQVAMSGRQFIILIEIQGKGSDCGGPRSELWGIAMLVIMLRRKN